MPLKNATKASVAELKEYLKALGMSQSGDKGTLLHRVKLYDSCDEKCVLIDGKNPGLLKLPELRGAAAQRGLSPIGNADELLNALVEHLMKQSSSSDGINPSSSDDRGVQIASQVLELGENGEHEKILSLAGTPITSDTPVHVMRKAYLKLSLLLHPDKLQKRFSQATRAFQLLVSAFERLSTPEIEDDAHMAEASSASRKSRQPKPTAEISRSNENCHRTRVCCPRCRQPWGENSVEGVPDYFYNFFMMGLKQYCCSTCLCEFGCMTATHKCPFCYHPFAYSPQDYHRHVTCNACYKSFGFYLFHVSNRVYTELKLTIKAEHEAYMKAKRTRMSRNARARKHDINVEDAVRAGLSDICPRCGEMLDGENDIEHLMQCNDIEKHKSYKEARTKLAKKEKQRNEKMEQQQSAQELAMWNFLGKKQSQLWLLDDAQLRQIAQQENISDDGTKEELLERITKLQEHDEDERTSSSRSKRRKNNEVAVHKKRRLINVEDLPSNLYSQTVADLKAICIAHGFRPKGKVKEDIIAEIEDMVFED